MKKIICIFILLVTVNVFAADVDIEQFAEESGGDIAEFTHDSSWDEGEDYDECPEYNTTNKLRVYIEEGNIKALSEYITFLTPEQQEETEIDFAFDKKNTVLTLILDMEKFDLFNRFMEDKTETKRWANELMYASAERGHLEAVKYLVLKGANVNFADESGYTPVIAALENNHIELVEYLVGRGADLNLMVSDYYPNASHETPLLFKYY